jgi:XTP/dITP diphosphohydrolase
MRKLLLATTNRGKAAEYRAMLAGLSLELITLDQAGIDQEAPEDFPTFKDNARSKAVFYANLSGLLTLADDSGLEVESLGGEPGVRSSRYAGDNATDIDRVNCLLAKMKDIPEEARQARFRCVIAIAEAGGQVHFTKGDCLGRIAFRPAGDNGFGYDPVFYIPEYNQTIAQLPPEVKNRISHRGRAALKAIAILKGLSARSG